MNLKFGNYYNVWDSEDQNKYKRIFLFKRAGKYCCVNHEWEKEFIENKPFKTAYWGNIKDIGKPESSSSEMNSKGFIDVLEFIKNNLDFEYTVKKDSKTEDCIFLGYSIGINYESEKVIFPFYIVSYKDLYFRQDRNKKWVKVIDSVEKNG